MSHLCFSANAHSWLTNIKQELHNGTEAAGITGSEQEDCQIIFPCNQKFTNYRQYIADFLSYQHGIII